jgi:hypothetical protein
MTDEKKKENPIAKKFKAVANEFVFDYFIEEFKPTIIKNFRDWLVPFTPDKIQQMVRNGEMPELDPEWFETISGYRKYLLKIRIQDMAEFIALARKDLMTAIMECGEDGHLWLLKLRVYLLECVDHPEKLLKAEPEKPAPGDEMVNAVCDKCGKKWPVKKKDFASIKGCPYCGESDNKAASNDEVKQPEKTETPGS